MDSLTLIAIASIVIAGLTTGFGTMGPALAEGRAVATALTALAQQPDASATITRTLFVGLARIFHESRTGWVGGADWMGCLAI